MHTIVPFLAFSSFLSYPSSQVSQRSPAYPILQSQSFALQFGPTPFGLQISSFESLQTCKEIKYYTKQKIHYNCYLEKEQPNIIEKTAKKPRAFPFNGTLP